MKYSNFFFSMTRIQQDEYALKAGTTGDYLRTHIFVPMKRRKIPRKDKIDALVTAASSAITLDDVLAYLYKSEEAKNAA